MKALIGIAIEQFEYNERWKTIVIFLVFFSLSTLSLNFLVAPKVKFTKENGNAAIDLLSEKLNLSSESEEKANSIIDGIKDIFTNGKEDLLKTDEKENKKTDLSIKVDALQEPVENVPEKPTTLETLNED